MGKEILLVRSNIRKSKGQTTAIIVLILLAALMLNLWLMLAMDYRQNFDRYHDRLNAEHVMLAVDGDRSRMQEFLTQALEDDSRTDDFSLDDAMIMAGSFPYNGGELTPTFVVLEKQAAVSRQVGRVEIVEDSDLQSGVYLPLLYRSDDIAVGKTITITIGANEITYTICGFFNSIMAGSHNCVMCELVLTADKFSELQKLGYAWQATLCSVRITDKAESESFESTLSSAVYSQYPQANMLSNSYALVSQSRYVSQMICSGIMSAAAFLILLIALVVIASNIINYIQENMKNLGVLKSVGYTSRQLIASLLLQFAGLSLIAAAAGAGVSYSLFPFVNTMMISQTGIPYTVHFLPLQFLITLVILGGSVMFTVLLSSRRIKKAEPVSALRQGILTHNFRRNHVPLESTGAPLNLALALKTTLSGKKHNITICITMLVLSLVVVFSGLITTNMLFDMSPFINLVAGETADSAININTVIENEFLNEMNADDRMEKIYLYTDVTVNHVGGTDLTATVISDYSEVNNQTVVFEGRFPMYDNEIAVAAKYAKENSLKIGDEITISAGGNEAAYLICGLTQLTNNLGKDCLLTRAGYEQIGKLQNVTYYLNIADGIDIDEFHSEAAQRLGNDVNALMNVKTLLDASASVYISLMKAIVIAILVLSLIVIVFVLYLLVRTMLNSKRLDYGIMKALGFTTGQLILQTAVSFMPSVILSTAAGLIISSMIINPLMSLFLYGIGIVKCTFPVPVGFNTAAGIGLILFAFAVACLLSLKVRKIAPRALLAGE